MLQSTAFILYWVFKRVFYCLSLPFIVALWTVLTPALAQRCGCRSLPAASPTAFVLPWVTAPPLQVIPLHPAPRMSPSIGAAAARRWQRAIPAPDYLPDLKGMFSSKHCWLLHRVNVKYKMHNALCFGSFDLSQAFVWGFVGWFGFL